MHPMLRLTISSCVFALGYSLALPFILDKMNLTLRRVITALLPLCIVCAILMMTLHRSSNGIHQMNLTLFWSYRQWKAQDVRWQIMMNIALFAPLGASLRSLKLHPIVVFLLGLALSVCIEYTQYRYALGLCEADDVFNNTLGAMMGYYLYYVTQRYQAIQSSHKQKSVHK